MHGVLHLHPAQRDFQTARCLDLLRSDLAGQIPMRAMSLGRGGDFRNLPEAIARLRFGGIAQDQIAHTWGPAELVAAAAGGFSRIIFSPQGKIHQKWKRWVDRLLICRSIEVVCPTAWTRNHFLSAGVPAERCHHISPAMDMSRVNGADPRFRRKLGLIESDIVLLAPGESVREAGHFAAIWAAAILNTLDSKWRMLVWGRGPTLVRMAHFAKSSKLDRLLVDAEQVLGEPVEFERLASAADGAIVFSEPSSQVLPVAVCMAAGLPIIASGTSELAEFLADGSNALMQPNSNPREVAQRTLALAANSALREKISTTARTEAGRKFAKSQFIGEWLTIYGDLLG